MNQGIADTARDFEKNHGGHHFTYAELKCNQFVLAVLRAAVAADFPETLANDFASSSHFAKIDRPAAGDLVHWPGHIGIVIDPTKGTFIGSQTSTGVKVASYKTGWWAGGYGGKRPDYFLRYQ